MAERNDLINAPGDAISRGPFVLDNRSDEILLQQIHDYAAIIPFDSTGHSWADLLFMPATQGDTVMTPEALAQLFNNPDSADGTLLPQQVFLLAFLQLLKTPRALLNAFPSAHRELYYRDLLGGREKAAQADHVVLSLTLKPTTREYFIPAGTLFDGGQDSAGTPLHYALDKSLLVNRSSFSDLRWVQPDPTDTIDKVNDRQLSRVAFDQQNSDWPTQGCRLFDPEIPQQPVVNGRLVASSLLAMNTGDRTITLTSASNIDSARLSVAQVSSGGQWLDLTLPDPATNTTTLVLRLSGDAPAISAPVELDGLTLDTPVVKLGRTDGSTLAALTSLTVTCTGSAGVRYSTDNGVNRLDNLSYPLGTSPVVGSGFNLMMPDWCNRTSAITLSLTPQWVGLPNVGFHEWYAGYDSIPSDNSDFTLQPWLMSGAGRIALSNDINSGTEALPQPLFSGGTGVPVPATLDIILPPLISGGSDTPNNPCDGEQWLRLELVGRDFGHQDYQKLAGTKTLNPPYTPQMNGLTVSYTLNDSEFSQYVLTPFGYQAADAAMDDTTKSYLYLGFTDGEPGETLSLYWQIQSPQALNPDWFYLNKENNWLSLASTVVDDTQGLRVSGVWTATLPHDIATQAARMPGGRFWLRATLDHPCGELGSKTVTENGFVWLQGLETNAMTATLDAPQSVSRSHFMHPVPANTVTRMVTPVNEISRVTQPWPSEGGLAAETLAQFTERTAARLSHRDRALAWQDMTELLKAGYSNVFDVALPSTDILTQLPAPLVQSLLVIPVNACKDNQDALRPLFSQAHLNEMSAYLQSRASAWADIQLINPSYRDVPIAYDVSFNVNPDYGYRQLQESLTLRYMPWVAERNGGVTLGNILDYYGIIAWIQQQPWVVQLNSLTLDGGKVSVQGGRNEVLILTEFNETGGTV